LLAAARDVGTYDWVLFTSANGVDAFFKAVKETGGDSRRLGKVRIGVIGPRTARSLHRYGLQADLVAEEFVGEGLAQSLLALEREGRVLIPRALEARDELPRSLQEAGMTVDVVPAYETRPIEHEHAERLRQLIERREVDTVLFTSSSMVTSTVRALGPRAVTLLGHLHVASIGPITTATAAELGVTVHTTAREYTVAGLLDALAEPTRG
jgi:uroporphyrinogen III methyltransferase/synthase